MSDISDQELVHKLATTFHLSVPERAALLAIPVPGSLVRSAILAILKEQGPFPPHWKRDSPHEEGLIEVNPDGSCSITWKGGSAVMRPVTPGTTDVRRRRPSSLSSGRLANLC